MKNELLGTISENFVTIAPLLKKKIFKTFPIELMPLHMSRTNLEALFILFEMRRATVTELSNQLIISRSNLTPLIDKLVQHKLAERTSSEEDRRVIQIEITTEGDQFCKEIHGLLLDQIQSKLNCLDNDDLIELKKCILSLKSIVMKIT